MHRSLLVALLLVDPSQSCLGKNPTEPGELLGTYSVHAVRVEDSCGTAPAVWDFPVRLSRDDAALYWIQGGLPVAGKPIEAADGSVALTLASTSVTTLREANPKLELLACAIRRDDALSVTLAKGLGAFTGSLEYRYAVRPGANCDDIFQGGYEGVPLAPCSVRFEISGSKQ